MRPAPSSTGRTATSTHSRSRPPAWPIRFLTIRNFGTGLSNNNEGVVNHDAGNNWTIENNTIMNNDGAGIFVGDGNVIRNNCLRDNGQYGLSAYEVDGVTSIVVDRNEILHNNTDNWEARIDGCGCTGGAKFWDVSGAIITNNWVRDNLSVGLWADTNNRDFVVEGNWFEGNQDEAFWYEVSYNARIRYNVFVRNTLVKGRQFAQRGDNFPVAAVYLSEAGGDPRVVGPGSIDISFNLFQDNWSGVTLWENADRYCNSPANTSSDYCTLGGAATLQTCVAGTISRQPYYSDCRWKTQNVAVHHNEFRVNPAAIGCINNWCARQAVLSNFGTFPSWSPYQGERHPQRHHLQPEQPLVVQHLRRPLAVPGPRHRDHRRLERLARRSLQPGSRQHHRLAPASRAAIESRLVACVARTRDSIGRAAQCAAGKRQHALWSVSD